MRGPRAVTLFESIFLDLCHLQVLSVFIRKFQIAICSITLDFKKDTKMRENSKKLELGNIAKNLDVANAANFVGRKTYPI